MKTIPIQLTDVNIKYINSISSFAKIVNTLIDEMRENKELESKIISKIKTELNK